MTNIPTHPQPAVPGAPDAVPFGPGRLTFTIAFGVVLPVVCLALDPIVFRSSDGIFPPVGSPMLGAYRVAGYSTIVVGIASLLIWMTLRRPAGVLAGALAGGAAFAFGLGLLLLPFTFLGLFLIVGALGLVPFATAWVFVRSASAAWRAARHRAATRWAAVGFLVACGLPWALQAVAWSAARSATESATSADPEESERGVERLRWLQFVTGADELVWTFGQEQDPARRQRLVDAYRRVTGDELESRLAVLRD